MYCSEFYGMNRTAYLPTTSSLELLRLQSLHSSNVISFHVDLFHTINREKGCQMAGESSSFRTRNADPSLIQHSLRPTCESTTRSPRLEAGDTGGKGPTGVVGQWSPVSSEEMALPPQRRPAGGGWLPWVPAVGVEQDEGHLLAPTLSAIEQAASVTQADTCSSSQDGTCSLSDVSERHCGSAWFWRPNLVHFSKEILLVSGRKLLASSCSWEQSRATAHCAHLHVEGEGANAGSGVHRDTCPDVTACPVRPRPWRGTRNALRKQRQGAGPSLAAKRSAARLTRESGISLRAPPLQRWARASLVRELLSEGQRRLLTSKRWRQAETSTPVYSP